MRLFFALPISPSEQYAIDEWRRKAFGPLENTVPMANFHVTLSFLGDISENKLDSLIGDTETLLQETPFKQFTIENNQTGFWSKQGILWVGPIAWSEDLSLLNRKLNNLAGRFGAKKDKRAYQPHITIARKCLYATQPITEPNFSVHCDTFSLYESIKTRNGVIYQEIEHWPLLGRPDSIRQTNNARKKASKQTPPTPITGEVDQKEKIRLDLPAPIARPLKAKLRTKKI